MPNRDAESLVHRASHDSVTLKRLTKTKGTLGRFLSGDPIITYLEEGEQPHFIFTKGPGNTKMRIITHDGKQQTVSTDLYQFLILTDRRILVVSGRKEEDYDLSCSFDDVNAAKFYGNIFQFVSNDAEFLVDYSESGTAEKMAGKFLRELDIPERCDSSYTEKLAIQAENPNVTPPRLLGIEQYFEDVMSFLEEGEQPLYLLPLTTGSSALLVEAGAHRDELLDTGDGGTLAVTDRYVRVIGPKGDWSIPYSSISSIDYVGNPSLHIQTPGRTYYVNLARVHFSLEQEAAEATKYIRSKQRQVENSSPSSDKSTSGNSNEPLEKLKQLGELRDQGVLSEEEFEQMKSELLDQI